VKAKNYLQPVLSAFDRYLLGTIVAVYIGFKDAYDDRWFKVIGVDITKTDSGHRVFYRLQAIGKNNTVIGITNNVITGQEDWDSCIMRDELHTKLNNIYLDEAIGKLFPYEYQRLIDKCAQIRHLLSIYPPEPEELTKEV